MFVNSIHQWPVIKRFLTWPTSTHLFPLFIMVPWWSVKTSGLHQYDLVHFDSSFIFLQVTPSTFICCSFITTTSYMLAPELRDCTMYSTSYDLVPGDSVTCVIRYLLQHHWWVFYMWYLDLILTCTSGQWSNDSLCTFQFSYTCIHFGSINILYFHWAWVCPPQTWFDSLTSFIGFLVG